MPSLFPYLLNYQEVAPLIIRVVLGVTLAYFGWHKVKGHKLSSGSNSVLYGWLELFIAVFLIIGFWTQLAALLNAVILIIKLGWKAREGKLVTNGINYYILLLAMAVSVVLTGPGLLAFDMHI